MDEFSAYLLYLCKTVYDSTHELNPEAVLRTHFRYWNQNGEAEQYFQAQVYGAGFDEYVMQPLDWGELLEEAFENNKPLIASVNSRYCKKSIEKNERKETNKWENFMMVIPQFVDNKYTEREEITKKVLFARPLITFGLTVYREEDKELLYILDYLKLDEVIGTVIKEFLHYFPIEIYKYVIKLAEIKKGVRADADNE